MRAVRLSLVSISPLMGTSYLCSIGRFAAREPRVTSLSHLGHTAPARAPHSPTVSAAAVLPEDSSVKMRVRNLSVSYSGKVAVEKVDIDIPKNRVLALIGPSGCGKSTFLRSLNRMNDTVEGVGVEGQVVLDGRDIYAPGIDPVLVRRQVGMVFQRSNPFPKSIFDNVAYGLRIAGMTERGKLAENVERALSQAALWDEVKDRLHESGLSLSGGQQQRLCIARALAVEPEVLLMDEPASALDPIATAKVEDLVSELRG